MIFIGDVHGEFDLYHDRLEGLTGTIQLGDMGIGFGRDVLYRKLVARRHMFIRGNHDNPEICRQLPQYLGDFGYLEESELFFVSGGYSVDRVYRTEGIDWWPDEELSLSQMPEVVDLYERSRPRIVATHDCPLELYDWIYPGRACQESPTNLLFDTLLHIHRPKAWVFGHHHKSLRFDISGTRFIGLAPLEVVDLKEIEIGDGADAKTPDLHDGIATLG